MTTPTVLAVPQIDGTRYLALTAANARWVRQDRAVLDCVPALACLDVDTLGRRTWERPSGCADSAEGREAILRALRDREAR
jgi:hypothetical protein